MPTIRAQQRDAELTIDQAFAHPARIRILALIADAARPVTAIEIDEQLPGYVNDGHDISQLQYHLQILAGAGIVTVDSRKPRGERVYSPNPGRWLEVVDTVDAWSTELAVISDRLANASVGRFQTRTLTAVPVDGGNRA